MYINNRRATGSNAQHSGAIAAQAFMAGHPVAMRGGAGQRCFPRQDHRRADLGEFVRLALRLSLLSNPEASELASRDLVSKFRRFMLNSPRISAKFVSVSIKCPILSRKCPTFFGRFVNVSFVFIHIPALNVIILFFCFPVFPAGPSRRR